MNFSLPAPDWVLAAAMAVLGWAALRFVNQMDRFDVKLDDVTERVIAVETKLDNGLSHSVDQLRSGFDDLKDGFGELGVRLAEHIEGEEGRILNFQRDSQRGGNQLRTRQTDRRVKDE